MRDVYLLIVAGQIGEGNGAEIRFPARGGLTVVRVGTGFTIIAAVPQGKLPVFLARAQKALERAGHPTRLLCVLP